VTARRVVAPLTLVLALSGTAWAAAARPLVTIGAPGTWTLARLGYGDLVLRENQRTARTEGSVYYRLPAGAAEGPGHWYLIHLHYAVKIRPDATPGDFNVAAATDGRYAASTIFTVQRRNGRLMTTADDLGLVGGHVRQRSFALDREIRFENFLAYGGVRPGRNELRFELTSNAVPMVSSVRIFRDTSIEFSPLGPTAAALDIRVDAGTRRVGRPFTVRFTLRRVRGQPVPVAAVTALYRAGSLRTDGPRIRRVRWGAARSVNGSFRLTPLREGRLPLALRADIALHPVTAVTAVDVTAAPAAGVRWWLWMLVALATAAGGVAAAAGLRKWRL
jgi:hypothetical protein